VALIFTTLERLLVNKLKSRDLSPVRCIFHINWNYPGYNQRLERKRQFKYDFYVWLKLGECTIFFFDAVAKTSTWIIFPECHL